MLVAVSLFGADCGAGPGAIGSEHGKLDVVASTTQIGDFARQVGGREAVVYQILKPNTDPHEYEPRPTDVEATAGAKLVFVNGDGLDSWMGKVLSESGSRAKVVDIGKSVPVRLPGESTGDEVSRYDPHWWHNPQNAEAAVRKIRNAMITADPAHKTVYEENAAAYLEKLKKLDAGIRACMKRVPERERKLVTDHDAFNYFARRYGIKVVGAVIPSQSVQAQPSAGEISRLISLIRREHVKAVFPEKSVNADLARTIAHETGASSHYMLYGDALGPKGSDGSTYLKMEAHNASAMVRGFTGGKRTCNPMRGK